ncbi:unnamed protein product [Natator depressus]
MEGGCVGGHRGAERGRDAGHVGGCTGVTEGGERRDRGCTDACLSLPNFSPWSLARCQGPSLTLRSQGEFWGLANRPSILLQGSCARWIQRCKAMLPPGVCLFVSRRYEKMLLPEMASLPTAELEESIRHHSRKRRALQDKMWESREILTLDAASAHPGLVVSPDRHSVWHGNSWGCSLSRPPSPRCSSPSSGSGPPAPASLCAPEGDRNPPCQDHSLSAR